jgi:EmrB/QacA subfamily drug resistance transporter
MSRPLTLAATVAGAGIVQLPTAAVVVALPQIHAEFGTSIAELQWTVTAFMIPFSSFLIAAGRLADIFGRKRFMLAGTTLFAIGSVIAATAPGIVALIAGIAVAGAGGAMIMPASMSILTNVFTGEKRGTAIGMWGAATELVSGIGVLIGGVLTGALDWRWIFVVCFLIAVAIAVTTLRGAPESSDPEAPRKVDLLGVGLSVSALTTLTLALIQGAAWGWGSAAIVGLIVAAVVLATGFVLTERRASNPIIDFGFFRRRNFAGATVVIFVLDFSFGALLFFLPLYFQEILGYTPTEVGLLLLPLTGLMVVGSPAGGKIAGRVGVLIPIATGLAVMAVAVWLISGLDVSTDYADLWLPTALMGFGVGFALTPMNLAAMNAVRREHAGAASGMLVTLSGLGATLGVAVTGAIFNQLNAERTVSEVAKTGITISEDQARSLDGVLAGADGATKTLDRIAGGKTAEVERALREAFVDALGSSLRLSAALIAIGLVLALILIRRSDPVDQAAPMPPVGGAPTPRPAPRRIDAGVALTPGGVSESEPGPARAPG